MVHRDPGGGCPSPGVECPAGRVGIERSGDAVLSIRLQPDYPGCFRPSGSISPRKPATRSMERACTTASLFRISAGGSLLRPNAAPDRRGYACGRAQIRSRPKGTCRGRLPAAVRRQAEGGAVGHGRALVGCLCCPALARPGGAVAGGLERASEELPDLPCPELARGRAVPLGCTTESRRRKCKIIWPRQQVERGQPVPIGASPAPCP